MDVYGRWAVLSVVLLVVAGLVSAFVPNLLTWVAPSVGVVAAGLVSIWLPKTVA